MNLSKLTLWLLVASLALNVFLAVVVGTRFFHPPRPPHPERIIEDMADALPDADARILRDALAAKRGAFADDRDGPRQYHDRLRTVLTAEPFDVEAFRRLAAEFNARRERTGQVISDILADALPRMSPEGREALADFRPPPPPKP